MDDVSRYAEHAGVAVVSVADLNIGRIFGLNTCRYAERKAVNDRVTVCICGGSKLGRNVGRPRRFVTSDNISSLMGFRRAAHPGRVDGDSRHRCAMIAEVAKMYFEFAARP